jgi:hypothetical protein
MKRTSLVLLAGGVTLGLGLVFFSVAVKTHGTIA